MPAKFQLDVRWKYLVVGNQNSSTVCVFAFDRTSGALTPAHETAGVTSPNYVFRFRLASSKACSPWTPPPRAGLDDPTRRRAREARDDAPHVVATLVSVATIQNRRRSRRAGDGVDGTRTLRVAFHNSRLACSSTSTASHRARALSSLFSSLAVAQG